MKADEFARLSCLISNRVARLEGEVTMLSSTCSLASKKHTVDPSAERIKCLEAELAETKKDIKEIIAKQQDLIVAIEQMGEYRKMKQKPIFYCW